MYKSTKTQSFNMQNEKRLKEIFVNVLGIELEDVNQDLKYQQNPQWDSINHMFLVTELETVFEVQFESEEILELNTYPRVKNILFTHGLSFE